MKARTVFWLAKAKLLVLLTRFGDAEHDDFVPYFIFPTFNKSDLCFNSGATKSEKVSNCFYLFQFVQWGCLGRKLLRKA